DEETRFRAPGQRLDESIEKLRLRGPVLVVGEQLGVVGHDLIQLGEFLLTQEAAHQAPLSAHRGRTTARSTLVATANPAAARTWSSTCAVTPWPLWSESWYTTWPHCSDPTPTTEPRQPLCVRLKWDTKG